jgi:hypothetical protein
MNGVSGFKTLGRLMLAALMALLPASAHCGTEESLKNTPFAYGDDFPDKVAACESVREWAGKAPQTDARFNMAVKGALSRVSGGGGLVYLAMCKDPDLIVTCVTYSRNGMSTGDVVTFVGGYRQLNNGQVLLDPCLASSRD